ncbi:hypothetical protein [Kyrpidia sp.]|uniref:hypothetical protein n=1 Tax=Kyrpidia sp. TaxID=2073077 RepID=UPI00258C3C55|nr:hypothetical protein [Kyrpidia sp.]MCL6577585.1 hypothetical protein [Kyrpidia sp.]
MPEVVHTIPFFVLHEGDLEMVDNCLITLTDSSTPPFLVVYNQGLLTNDQVVRWLSRYPIQSVVLGRGINDGIPIARQKCFEYIWDNLPETKYITEIHMDMLFPQNWTEKLVEFLEQHPEEPFVSPGIITGFGELHPEAKGKQQIALPIGATRKDILPLLNTLTTECVVEGFVHPVLHRCETLHQIGGYDLQFLPGKQGYEDDFLLLSYFYLLKLPISWRPKALLSVRVFHRTLAQRMNLPDKSTEMGKNFHGLLAKFGIQGLRDLSKIHNNEYFEVIAKRLKL